MKRLMLLSLILAVFLTACSGPVIQTSPSLGHQTTPATTQDNGLDHAGDYSALIKLVRQAQTNISRYPTRFNMAEAMAGTADSKQSTDTAATDYSQTNIQVEGVDEADIIKTDGSYLYLVANNRLYVVDGRDPAKMTVLSAVTFTASQETDKIATGESPVAMYLDAANKRLTLIVSGWLYEKTPVANATAGMSKEPASAGISKDSLTSGMIMPRYNNKQYTSTKIYDISNKSAPNLVRQFSQEGNYVASRKIDEAVYVVTNQYNYLIYADPQTEPKPADIFPATRDTLDPVTEKNWNTVAADKISILPNADVSNQMILSAINTLKDGSKPAVISVLGSSGIVYASAQYLYVAAYNYQWEGKENSTPIYQTDLYRFRLAGAQISEAGKGSVPGTVINQFSMDEYHDFFRIATTSYETGSQKAGNVAKNNVYVLDASLKTVGSVVGLAPGETIKSVRFMSGKAYVVTFRNVDPLFVIDLSQPTAPKVLGQLKIPGYSTYLHPYDENKLLGFGYDVRNEGSNAYNMGLKVSLFDIADFGNPKELSTILLGSRGSSADILYNHKSLLFSREKNLIAFPAILTKTVTNSPLEYGQPVFQGLLVLAVDNNNQLTLRGQITHFDKLNDPNGKPSALTNTESQAFYGYDAISRGVWIGNVLFTFSARQIRSANLETLAKIGQIELPGYEDYNKTSTGGGIASSRGVLID